MYRIVDVYGLRTKSTYLNLENTGVENRLKDARAGQQNKPRVTSQDTVKAKKKSKSESKLKSVTVSIVDYSVRSGTVLCLQKRLNRGTSDHAELARSN
jgi:hypothetical protein